MQSDRKILGLRPVTLATVIIIAVSAVASVALYGGGRTDAKPGPAPAKPAAKADAKADMDKLAWLAAPVPVPATAFTDAAGTSRTLADFAGKALVVNFWATWCGPCVEEMPTLDALQAALGGERFAVVAINQDREGMKVAQPFVAKNGWKNIALYVEPSARFARDAALRGLPTSLVVDRQGREVARVEGTLKWDAPEVQAALRKLIEAP
jgi:thiol-disulfide isomerase/thioredoxin